MKENDRKKNSCTFADKVSHKLHGTILRKIMEKWSGYRSLYASYRHYIKNQPDMSRSTAVDSSHFYLTEIPNSGAGIGHQLANWMTGYWLASHFKIKYAHSPFPSTDWEEFLGFGEREISAEELVKKYHYKKVLLPPFSTENEQDAALIKSIMISYSGQKIVFFAEQDTAYMELFPVGDAVKTKFNNAPSRIHDRLIYKEGEYHIAVHIRRGDIGTGSGPADAQASNRWLDNAYYYHVLKQLFQTALFKKNPVIYIFSQEKKENLKEFEEFANVVYCLDMPAPESFLHMVRADLLITSKSSFSYKPALLSDGIKICPRNFWHGYPNEPEWVLAENDGTIDEVQLQHLKEDTVFC